MFKLLHNCILIASFLVTMSAISVDGPQIIAESEDQIIALLNDGVNPNTMINDYQGTLLHVAASRGYVNVFELVHTKYKDMDLNPSIPNGDGQGLTPLHKAAYNEQTKIFAWFKTHYPAMNLNPAIPSGHREGQTPLHCAAQAGKTTIFDWFYQYCRGTDLNPDATGPNDGITPLIDATNSNKTAMIEWFAQHKVNIDQGKRRGNYKDETPLGIAVVNGNVDTARYLVFLGAMLSRTPDIPNDRGYNHMIEYLKHCAPKTQQLASCCDELKACTEQLCGSQTQQVNQGLETEQIALIDQIKSVIESGAEFEPPAEELACTTSLHRLAHIVASKPLYYKPVLGLIHWLIKIKHANINAKDLEENTPLSLARACGNKVLVHFL